MKTSALVDHGMLAALNSAGGQVVTTNDAAILGGLTAGTGAVGIVEPFGTTSAGSLPCFPTQFRLTVPPATKVVAPQPRTGKPKDPVLSAFDLPNGAVGFNAEMPTDPADPEKRVAPREFKILNRGLTRVRKGGKTYSLLLDEQAEKAVFAAMGEQGREQLPLDYDHGMLGMISGPDSSASAGWFGVELRADGLYASNIEWTSRARKAIEEREYRFTSPAVMLEETDEVGVLRVAELINVALTNLPATVGQKPLVASAKQPASNEVQGDMDKKAIRLMLGLAEDATDDQVKAKLAELGAAAKAADEAKAAAEKLAALNGQLAALEAKAKVADQLGAKVAELEALQARRAWQAVFDQGDRDGKIPKSLHDWAKTQTAEQLSAFVAAAPVVHGSRTPAPAQGGASQDQLSAEEREVCKQLGIAPSVFSQAKRDQAHGTCEESAWTAPADSPQKFTSRYISAYRTAGAAK
jgi:phage I-like protein